MSRLWLIVENFGRGFERIRDDLGYFNSHDEALAAAWERYGAAEGDGWCAVPVGPYQPPAIDLRPKGTATQEAYAESFRGGQ